MKMKKRFLGILLGLVMALGLVPGMSLTALADGTYSGGIGTEADPYLISTVEDWKALAASVNGGEAYEGKYFRQTADLDMSGAGNLNTVGTLEHPFAGNYEGDGFAISGATINVVVDSGTAVAGIFGALVGEGHISNLRVTNVTATATTGNGGWDQAYAGGLVAFAENCTITDCSVSNSTITANGSNTFAGAFVGFAGAENSEKTTFFKCASENNTVNTYDYGGGFIGAIVNEATSDDAISFTDCYSAKNTADAGTYIYGTVGGFLGGSQCGKMTAQNCFVYDCKATATGTGSGKGVFTGDTTYGTVQASNTYYYDTQNLPANAESATAKTADEMKSLASALGEAFTQGSDYPILLHQVNLEVSIEGWTYGEDANEPSVTRNSSGTPTYTYADKGTTDFSATVPSNAGNYTVKATVEETATHKAAEATADFTIAKATPAITVPAPNAVTYDPAKTLANVTLPTGWAWENENTVPTVGNNGYAAVYTVSDDTNYDYSGVEGYSAETHKVTRTVELTVNKATVVAATVTANNRTYDGTEKPLVNVTGEATGGETRYALGDNATTAPDESLYTTSIPAKTDAGTYYVWYKVVGDENHTDSEAKCVAVTIAKKDEPKPAPTPTPDAEIVPAGTGHLQGAGDVAAAASGRGVVLGSTGQSRRLEQIALSLPEGTDGGIEYRAHLQGTGWSDFVADGAACGTTGQSKRMEAVQLRLAGKVAETHSVWYRVHSQTLGWLGWARDGEAAGTAGQSRRAEAVEVQVLPKGQSPEGYEPGQASYVGAATANVHLQGTGWSGARSALEFGTTGQSRRLEAIQLTVPNQPEEGGISYAAHLQGTGWTEAVSDGALAGTTGQAKRLEAVRINLTGDLANSYSVWYRVHSQTHGWLGWAKDGEVAGTIGLSKRAEAIDVQILPAGQVPAGYDAGVAAAIEG